MKRIVLCVLGVMLATSIAYSQTLPTASVPKNIYAFSAKTINGKDKPLSDYKGKVLLIVNTASKCHFTPQYQALEELYNQYKSQGFEILAFPSNDFNNQEPGDNQEIKKFCSTKYKISFPLFAKIQVRGEGMHPLFQYLTTQAPQSGGVTWNFNKFLVDKKGKIVARFASRTDPQSPELKDKIKQLLSQ